MWSGFAGGRVTRCIGLSGVCEKMHCNEPIAKLYYVANFNDICVYCASDSVAPWSNNEDLYYTHSAMIVMKN